MVKRCHRCMEKLMSGWDLAQSPCGYLRAIDVERAVFQLVDSEEMNKVRTLLEGPLDQ